MVDYLPSKYKFDCANAHAQEDVRHASSRARVRYLRLRHIFNAINNNQKTICLSIYLFIHLLLHKKQCRTLLTGEKPCINKATHALFMLGFATFNMLVPGPQNCCRYEMCTALP